MLNVTLLGTGGMMPLKDRALTSLYAAWNGHAALIDCGEGTQVQIRAAGLSFKNIDILLLTHYHADHVSGLPGLLLSISNAGRVSPLVIAGPPGLERVVNGLSVITPELSFDLRFEVISLREPRGIDCEGLIITPVALQHSMPCLGYRLHLPRQGLFDPERARANGVPLRLWSVLQKQPEAEADGVRYDRSMVMGPPRRGLTVVYATDTQPVPGLDAFAADADLLIVESMYGDPEKQAAAREKGHMMMAEAAVLARDARVRRAWLTHFSPAMPDPEAWLPAAQAICPLIELGEDGRRVDLAFTD